MRTRRAGRSAQPLGRGLPDAGGARRPLDGARLDRRRGDGAQGCRGAVGGDAGGGGGAELIEQEFGNKPPEPEISAQIRLNSPQAAARAGSGKAGLASGFRRIRLEDLPEIRIEAPLRGPAPVAVPVSMPGPGGAGMALTQPFPPTHPHPPGRRAAALHARPGRQPSAPASPASRPTPPRHRRAGRSGSAGHSASGHSAHARRPAAARGTARHAPPPAPAPASPSPGSPPPPRGQQPGEGLGALRRIVAGDPVIVPVAHRLAFLLAEIDLAAARRPARPAGRAPRRRSPP